MKTEVKEVLGFEIEMQNIPTTIEEAVQLAGSEQAVLDNHIAYGTYHSHFGKLRSKIVERLSKEFDMKPETEEKNGKIKVIEKDLAFVARVRAEQGDEAVDALANEIRLFDPQVDWTPGSRGGGKLGAQWFGKVDELVEAGNFEAFCEKHGLEADDEDTLRTLAASKIKQLITAHLKKVENDALAV